MLLNIALSWFWETGRYTALKVGNNVWSGMTVECWVCYEKNKEIRILEIMGEE